MPEAFIGDGIGRPDFYVAAIGRSGSTILCNWLTRPPDHLVFIEPFFLRRRNARPLRVQLADFGMPASDAEWMQDDETASRRFRRLMAPRLEGRRWAFKEVLAEEHFQVLDAFAPHRVLITVRDIADVALSLFEKHRLQGNLDRYDDEWVRDYCLRESAGMVEFIHRLDDAGIPSRVLRYEEFARSEGTRRAAADFVGWQGGGAIDSHFAQLDRQFEVLRHGQGISGRLRMRTERTLGKTEFDMANEIASRCAPYQSMFGYT